MSSERENVAAKFVGLVLKYGEQWSNVVVLSPDEIQVLFDIVLAAGFNPKEVTPGKLIGYYQDESGANTSETYPINSLCPFKVIGQEGDGRFATGWLNQALQSVIWDAMRHKENQEVITVITRLIAVEIERSVPLEPIRLTLEGDLLCEYPPSAHAPSFEYFVDHTRDKDELGSCVGVHKFCNSRMDRVRVTETHDAIVCRKCHLRVLFPRTVRTYGDLRQALMSQQIPA